MSDGEELLLVVDEHDQPLDPLPRRLVHGKPVWHRVVHVWIYNDKHEILCQKRSLKKDLNPGYWEPFFGGHLRPGTSYEAAASRELEEELGLRISSEEIKHLFTYKLNNPTNLEFIGVFTLLNNNSINEFVLKDGEVEEIGWKTYQEVRSAVVDKTAKEPWTFCGYEPKVFNRLNKDWGGL